MYIITVHTLTHTHIMHTDDKYVQHNNIKLKFEPQSKRSDLQTVSMFSCVKFKYILEYVVFYAYAHAHAHAYPYNT